MNELLRKFLRDLYSDLLGGAGITMTMIPVVEEISQFIKLIASIGGLVLLYFSIKYKVELLKEKRIENRKKRKG